jgi:release factor glutamine methyltransferase
MRKKIIELGYTSIDADELIKVSDNIENDYNKLLNNYPIQYLIGYVNFYGNNINVRENVLIPRFETEDLVDRTIKYSKKIFGNNKVSILDIGTGSGAIAITLNKELNSLVDAIDISDYAINLATENNRLNNTSVNIIKSDLFNKVKGKYDIIISNPPYISRDEIIMDKVFNNEPHLALFADDNGLYFYKKILDECSNYLNDKFIIAFEIGMTQGEEISNYAKKIFKDSVVRVEKDLSLKDRFVFIINE